MSATGQRTTETKLCEVCGAEFARRTKYTRAQWDSARFCSNQCSATSKRTGSIDQDGRVWVTIGGRRFPRARIVFETAFGPLPKGAVVHHINRDPGDDRLENLRVFASHAEHMRFHALAGDCGFQPQHPKNVQRLVAR